MREEHRHMPDTNRLSVLIATILLAYALAHLIQIQPYSLEFLLFGVKFSLPLNLTLIATFLAAGLTAAGTDWLLRGHPHLNVGSTLQHTILPALTAFILGIPLYSLPFGTVWLTFFGLGGLVLLLVLTAEYIALDESDVRYPAASAGLGALSYAVFLVLAATLSYLSVRLVVYAVVIFPAAALVSLRNLRLRTGRWEFAWAFGITLAVTQLAAALHYWPIQFIQFGLALLGPLYALTELAVNLDESISPGRAVIEAVISIFVFWGVALFARG